MKKVALVMPVYNHLDYTRNCIRRLNELITKGRFNHCEYLIIVVDDGSVDGTSEWLSTHHPEVHLMSGDGSLWWSGGVNMGAAYAIEQIGADYILLWNNDITPAEDYFIQMDQLIPESGEEVIIGSKIFYQGDDQMVWSFGGIFDPSTGRKFMLGMDHPDNDRFQTPVEVDWLPGMGSLIPVQVIEKIGFWDDRVFPQYHGDSDFTYRAHLAGFRVSVYPQLRLWNDKTSSGITHEGSFRGLIRSLSSIRSNMNIRKNVIFYRRYATSWKAYKFLFRTYYKIIGGFFKWKILSFFGTKRDD